MGNFQKEEWVI